MDEEMMDNEFADELEEEVESDSDIEAPPPEEEDDLGNQAAESEQWRSDDEQGEGDGDNWRPSKASEEAREGSVREVKVAVDWVELEGALENNSPELHSFLNTVTGDVVRVFEGGENSDLRLKQAEASPDYLYIEPVSSREQYRWMEEFIEIVDEPTLKDKLNIAIDGKGAFRRFKDVLVGYPTERERWFTKRSAKLRTHMTDWLTSKSIVPTNTPPWEGDEENAEEVRRPRSDFEQRSWRDSSGDLRTQAHEMLDLVPSRELPTAVAFLEFLRGRRGYRRPRYG